jgi:hypothetical protein
VTGPVGALDDEVVDVGLDVPANLRLKHYPSHSSESRAGIFQTLCHSNEVEGSKGCDETGFFLILLRHPTLMLPREAI